MTYLNFIKLQSRHWHEAPVLDPKVLFKEFSEQIYKIEKRDFGVDEDVYITTTQAKIIINCLTLKIYEFLRDTITFIEHKHYVATIALLRLCLEHIAMLCFFNDKLLDILKKNDRLALRVLLTSFCMGERIFFVDAFDAKTGKKRFSTRAEHLSSALRHFDRNYPGLGIQTTYDILSNNTHVSPTSSVRMLYRQKVWNRHEPSVDFKRVRLSTKSTSHEQISISGVEALLKFFEVAKTNILNKQEDLYKTLEKVGKQIELNSRVNAREEQIIHEMMRRHDKHVQEFLSKFDKYGKPKKQT